MTDLDTDRTGELAPSCWHAFTLDERRLGGEPVSHDGERGRRRLGMWRDDQAYALDPDLLERRLSGAGMSEDDLGRTLGEETPSLCRRLPAPHWARRLAEVMDTARARPGPGRAPEEHLGFAELARPLLDDGRQRIADRVRAVLGTRHSRHVDPDRLLDAVTAPPAARIAQAVSKTLVLELNVLRLQQDLAGDTPDERFRDFLTRLSELRFVENVLAEYPVLARDLVALVDNWVDSMVAFVEHLTADVDDVVQWFRTDTDPTDIVLDGVAFEAGDLHRHGRSVGVLTFTDGTRVVYKPRSLSVDRHFHDLVDWLNAHGQSPRLRAPWVLDRGDHGWSEFITPAPCHDTAEVGRFYRRQGAFLALLHALAATDFHHENLIADGEHPMLVDLEALFHPDDEDVPDNLPVARHAVLRIQDSVMSVGLLPMPAVAAQDGSSVDLSGLGSPDGSLSLSPIPTWDGAGTDEMTLVRRRVTMEAATNRPTLRGDAVDVLDHRDQLVEGHRDTYRLLLGLRDLLLAPDGPVAAFAGDEVRVIVRPTHTYGHLLREGTHPDLLRDALDRDRFYGFLWAHRRWRSHTDELARSETAQLVGGDIPMFTATADSHDLTDGHGTLLPGVLCRSGLQRAISRIARWGEADLREQMWFLRGSLTALSMGGDRPGWVGYRAPRAKAAAQAADLVDAAAVIADRVVDDALVDGDRVAWIGLSLVADRVWQLGPTRIDAYNGTSGIALFLARAGHVTGDPRQVRMAELATEDVAARIRDLADVDVAAAHRLGFDIGGFGDIGGPLQLLAHTSVLWQRPDLADAACSAVPVLAALAAEDVALDVISGSAGCLLALLALHAATGRDDVLDAAGVCADRLVATAEPAGAGRAWRCSINPAAPLAGFSHGASGIAYALSRLDQRRGERRHAALVEDALVFEDGVRDQDHDNWRDLRDAAAGAPPMVAWCHGAAGVGLARAGLSGYLGPGRVADDLDRAVRGVLAAGFDGPTVTGSGNHSLCHGDLGNLELLATAAASTGDREAAHTTAVLIRTVLDSIERDGPLCGVPQGVQTPGLMAGISGIGHGLLRLAGAPDVGSVLTLDGPSPR